MFGKHLFLKVHSTRVVVEPSVFRSALAAVFTILKTRKPRKCHQYTVLSAGFSIFVHWKVAVNRVHNLRPCTGFLFPVYSRIYYGLYTVLYFTYKWTGHFRWRFFCTIKTADTVAVL